MYEFADRAGVTVQALLTMHRLGVLRPCVIDGKGQRYYRTEQLSSIDRSWIKRSRTLVFYYTLGSEDENIVESEVCQLRRRFRDTGVRVDYCSYGLIGCDSVLPIELLHDIAKHKIRKLVIVNMGRMSEIRKDALREFLNSHGCLLVDWRNFVCSI